jgi:outer membrane protein W
MDQKHIRVFQEKFRVGFMWQAVFIMFISYSTTLFAEFETKPAVAEFENKTASTEFRVSYFRPSSSLLRSIYGNAGVNYQLTGTVALTSFFYENSYDSLNGVNFWWAVDYFAKNGLSLGEDQVKTSFSMVPVTAGLKYIHPSKSLRPYIGLGLRYFFIQTSNNSEFVQKNINKSVLGGVVEGGVLFPLYKNFLLDIFAAYSQAKLPAPSNAQSNVRTTSLQVGGLNAGVGVSYEF